MHEYRVEFAFEDHRYWDMKRWRLADKVWNGNNNDPQARHRRLWPYRVVAPGDPNDGKWVFVEDFLFMSPNARYFRMQNYYNGFTPARLRTALINSAARPFSSSKDASAAII